MVRQGPLRGRPGAAGHAGLGAASARGAAPLRASSRPRRRAAAGGGAGRGRAAGRDLSDLSACTWATQAPRRSPPPWTEAPCRGSSASLCATPPSATRGWWPSRRPCGGGPRWSVSISVATRSATRASPPSWRRRRRQVRRRRRLEGWRSSRARPRRHPDHRRRLRHPRRCARQWRAAGARGARPRRHHCRRRGESSLGGALPPCRVRRLRRLRLGSDDSEHSDDSGSSAGVRRRRRRRRAALPREVAPAWASCVQYRARVLQPAVCQFMCLQSGRGV